MCCYPFHEVIGLRPSFKISLQDVSFCNCIVVNVITCNWVLIIESFG